MERIQCEMQWQLDSVTCIKDKLLEKGYCRRVNDRSLTLGGAFREKAWRKHVFLEMEVVREYVRQNPTASTSLRSDLLLKVLAEVEGGGWLGSISLA